MGSLQALEALKLLFGMPNPVAGTLRRFDALTHQWQTLTLAPTPIARSAGSADARHTIRKSPHDLDHSTQR